MRGTPGQHLLDKYQGRLEVAQQRHGADTIAIGHDGIPGNKRADEEAKKAMYGDSSPAPLLPKACRESVLVSRSVECQTHLKGLGQDGQRIHQIAKVPGTQEYRPLDAVTQL